jgi:predicted PhzF superfamily epimerase YddE/YHI9
MNRVLEYEGGGTGLGMRFNLSAEHLLESTMSIQENWIQPVEPVRLRAFVSPEDSPLDMGPRKGRSRMELSENQVVSLLKGPSGPDKALGNPCQLLVLPDSEWPISFSNNDGVRERLSETSHTREDEALCLVSRLAEGRLGVSCWQSGVQIDCCGHGLICAAAWWLANPDPGQTGELRLDMGGEPIVARLGQTESKRLFPLLISEPELIWLRFRQPDLMECAVPSWFSELDHIRPSAAEFDHADTSSSAAVKAVSSGGNTGYLLVELASEADLLSFQQPGPLLGKFTQRALIVTALSSNPAQYDVLFRYFAPQYGNPEDAATGSAMRVVTRYWSERLLNPAKTAGLVEKSDGVIRAWQASSKGGYLLGRLLPNQPVSGEPDGDGVSKSGLQTPQLEQHRYLEIGGYVAW